MSASALRKHPLFRPVLCFAAAVLLCLAAFSAARSAKTLRAREQTVRAEIAALQPDLEAALAYRARLLNTRDRLATRPPRFSPAEVLAPYATSQPAVTESDRILTGPGIRARTTELAYLSIQPDQLSRGLTAATGDGHRVTALEVSAAQPPGSLRARIRFLTLLPRN